LTPGCFGLDFDSPIEGDHRPVRGIQVIRRPPLTRLLLVLALLFSQQVGLSHASGHATRSGPTHEHKKGLPLQACDECVSFAQVQGASGLAQVPLVQPGEHSDLQSAPPCSIAARLDYRAPATGPPAAS
jgi:hypothetical protein